MTAEAALVLPVPVGWPGTLSSPLISLASPRHVNVYLLEMPAYLCDACLSVCLFIHVRLGAGHFCVWVEYLLGMRRARSVLDLLLYLFQNICIAKEMFGGWNSSLHGLPINVTYFV